MDQEKFKPMKVRSKEYSMQRIDLKELELKQLKFDNDIHISKDQKNRTLQVYTAILLKFCVVMVILGMFYWSTDISRKMLRSFWERPDSFTVDTLK